MDLLISYFNFCVWIFITLTFVATIVLRWTMPEEEYPRKFKAPIILAYIMTLIGVYLLVVPFLELKVSGEFFVTYSP